MEDIVNVDVQLRDKSIIGGIAKGLKKFKKK